MNYQDESLSTKTANRELFESVERSRLKALSKINDEAETHAKETCETDLLDVPGNLAHLITWIRDEFNGLNATLLSVLLPENLYNEAKLEFYGSNKAGKELKEKLVEAKKNKLSATRTWDDNKHLDTLDQKKVKRDKIIFYAIATGEVLFNASALMMALGDSILVGLAIAIGLTYSLIAYSKWSLRFIQRATTSLGKKFRFLVTSLVLIGVFLGLGFLRLSSLPNNATFEKEYGNWIIPVFLTINIVLYFGLIMSHRKLPSLSQLQTHRKMEKLMQALDEAKKLEQLCDANLTTHQKETPIKIAQRLEAIAFYNACLDKNHASYITVISKWKKTVIRFHHSVPVIFEEVVPELDIKYFNIQEQSNPNT